MNVHKINPLYHNRSKFHKVPSLYTLSSSKAHKGKTYDDFYSPWQYMDKGSPREFKNIHIHLLGQDIRFPIIIIINLFCLAPEKCMYIIYVCVYTYIYLYINICMCVHINIYIYMYVWTKMWLKECKSTNPLSEIISKTKSA